MARKAKRTAYQKPTTLGELELLYVGKPVVKETARSDGKIDTSVITGFSFMELYLIVVVAWDYPQEGMVDDRMCNLRWLFDLPCSKMWLGQRVQATCDFTTASAKAQFVSEGKECIII